MNLGLYRKAIAVFITQLVGILAQFAPGVAAAIGPETIQLLALLASTIVALLVSDKLDGFKVNDLAKALLKAATDMGREMTPDAVATVTATDKVAAVVLPDPTPLPPPENVVRLRHDPAPDKSGG